MQLGVRDFLFMQLVVVSVELCVAALLFLALLMPFITFCVVCVLDVADVKAEMTAFAARVLDLFRRIIHWIPVQIVFDTRFLMAVREVPFPGVSLKMWRFRNISPKLVVLGVVAVDALFSESKAQWACYGVPS